MKLQPETLAKLRGAALVGATVSLGISWSFALAHIKTPVYPLLWAAAMPLLAFYYISGAPRAAWKHLPAAALSIYALVLWRISGGYGVLGGIATALGVVISLGAFWLATRLGATAARSRAAAQPGHTASGAPRRRRARAAAGRR
jgi:hypothetical protein